MARAECDECTSFHQGAAFIMPPWAKADSGIPLVDAGAYDTTSSGGRLVFHLFGALAGFERNLVRERTTAGLAAARARGRVGGSRKQLDPEKRRLAVQLYAEKKHTAVEICRLMGISKTTPSTAAWPKPMAESGHGCIPTEALINLRRRLDALPARRPDPPR